MYSNDHVYIYIYIYLSISFYLSIYLQDETVAEVNKEMNSNLPFAVVGSNEFVKVNTTVHLDCKQCSTYT